MKIYIDEKRDINEEARNLLSIGYKNVVGTKRTAWRAVSNLEQKEKEKVKLLVIEMLFFKKKQKLKRN